jgi:hypothetical protein
VLTLKRLRAHIRLILARVPDCIAEPARDVGLCPVDVCAQRGCLRGQLIAERHDFGLGPSPFARPDWKGGSARMRSSGHFPPPSGPQASITMQTVTGG